ncbi:hypothetical protein C8R44DRAFT_980718 [Mycena epipterygia]|nr:hypothetical protein C8R44DRAFT_980718 [Mycena epipterygia]
MSRAANPCLEIEGVGPIGIPLSERIASALIHETSPDGPVLKPGVLELSADKIRFQNPTWDAWFQKEAGLICTELTGKPVQPSYRFRNLVIESASGSTSPELSVDAIGTLVVILPSSFTGGQLECRHGLQSKTIDFAPDSQLSTSVLAAYSAVTIARRDITSGYRLSLIYDILQPDGDPKSMPPFPDMEKSAATLRKVMLEWTEESEIAAYFLQRQYPAKKFNLKSLVGSDAVLVAYLIRFAEELGFQLYVVQLELYQSKYGQYESRTSKVDHSKITGLEEENELRSLHVNAVDTQGVPVQISRLDFREHKYLNGEIEDVLPRREYDLFGDDQIRVDEKYDRTLFLLWRTSDDSCDPVEIRYTRRYASWALQASSSTTPSKRELLLVDSIQAKRKANAEEEKPDEGVNALCKCAIQWSDMTMLLTTLEKNAVSVNLDLIGVENCVVAYCTFGWDALKIFFCEAVQKDKSNPRRQTLVIQLGQAAKATADAEVEAWCAEQQDLVLRSLNQASIAEIDWLLGLATEHGVDFMCEIVYPQLQAHQLESEFWVHFVRRLGDSVDNLPAFPTRKSQDQYRRVQDEPWPSSIMDVLKLCGDTGNVNLCDRILEKMKCATHSGAFPVELPPWKYYLELARSLDAYLSALLHTSGYAEARSASIFALSLHTGELDDAHHCYQTSGRSVLGESNTSVLLAGRDSKDVKTLVKHLVAEFQPIPGDTSLTPEHTVLLKAVVRQAIDVFDMKSFYTPGKPSSSTDDMIDMLKFCSEMGAQSEFRHLLVHFVASPQGVSIADHVSKVLAPFVAPLRDYLVSQGLDLETNPSKKCTARIVEAFATQVMCQKPTAVAEIGCQGPKCGDCPTLRDFFAGDDRSISLPRAAKRREHMESQLVATKSWGVRVTVDKDHGTPFRLEITKPANMTVAGLRAENSLRGKALVAVLGDESAQRRILGSAYEKVLIQICEGTESTATKRAAEDDQIDMPAKKARISPF